MDAGTHARVEEDEKKKALDSFRLRSSARLGFASSSGSAAAAAAATVPVSCRVTRRKRKKRRRQRRNSNEDNNIDVVVVDGKTTRTSASSPAVLEVIARREETTRVSSHGESAGTSASVNISGQQLDNVEERPRIRQGVHTAGESQEHERTGGSGGTRAAASSVSAGITLLNRRAGKRSSRRCNASGRRNAMTMDLQRLITEVHARPAIWDQKNVNYHNRDVILKMWREIARACEVSTDVAKSKWKHLRDNFRNELKKTYRGKCEGGGNEHDSKWVWFKSLFFLREQMNSRVIGCALSQNCSANLRSSPEGTQIEPQIDILEGHEETQFEDLDGDSCQSLLSNDEALHQVMPPPKLNKIGRKRALIDTTIEANDYSEIDRKRYESLQKRLAVAHEEEDDTYHFLMSVRNPLRSLPIDRQMFVRLKIQELVYHEINSQNQQQSQQNQQNRTYEQSVHDVKPTRIGGGGGGGGAGAGNPGTNSAGSGTTGNANVGAPGNGAEVVSDMSNSATLLQNCTTEGSSDDAFFG